MFDIGFWEMMVIAILAMVVIGPERLPGVARTVGRWFGKTRRFIEGVKEEVASEFDTTELKRLLHNQEIQLKELQDKVNKEGGDIRSGFSYNLDDEGAIDDNKPEDDYLEFMDEDEEKDHLQIAAEKHKKESAKKEADEQDESFEDAAIEDSPPKNDDDIVVSEVDKKAKNDG